MYIILLYIVSGDAALGVRTTTSMCIIFFRWPLKYTLGIQPVLLRAYSWQTRSDSSSSSSPSSSLFAVSTTLRSPDRVFVIVPISYHYIIINECGYVCTHDFCRKNVTLDRTSILVDNCNYIVSIACCRPHGNCEHRDTDHHRHLRSPSWRTLRWDHRWTDRSRRPMRCASRLGMLWRYMTRTTSCSGV